MNIIGDYYGVYWRKKLYTVSKIFKKNENRKKIKIKNKMK